MGVRSDNPLPSLFCFWLIGKTKWPPIGWDSFDFSSETADGNLTKLDRKQDPSWPPFLPNHFQTAHVDKNEEIWPSPMTKAPIPTEMSKGQVTTQTTPQKSSIKLRLRTDLGRSVGVTKATQLVWLTGLRAHLPTDRNSRVIKRTHRM